MLYIKRNEENRLVVTVSQHKTIADPSYLFSFEHILSKEKTRFYPKNVSTSTSRYDEFVFIEGEEPEGYTGDIPFVRFPHEGQHYYSVYETFNENSTDPNYAFDKLEEGRAIVEDDTIPSEFTAYISSNENNANFIYYEEGINEERIMVSMESNFQNSSASRWTWKYAYPDVYIKDLQTDVIETLSYTLTGEGLCNEYNEVFTDTYFKEITTGSTWAGFKVYYDETDVLSKGYNWDYSAAAGNQVSGTTYYNFRPGFLPIFWAYDYIDHHFDGTTSTGSTVWAKDVNTPKNIYVGPISGNSPTTYGYGLSGISGLTFSDVCRCSQLDACEAGTENITLYFNTSDESEFWTASNSGSSITYATEKCGPGDEDTNTYFFLVNRGLGQRYVAQFNGDGTLTYYDTCVPPTPTPTPTPTFTPTPSITPSITPTGTLTPTPTQTGTLTPTPTVTGTLTPTPTPSAVITYNLLTEGSDTITTEGNDPIRTEQT